MLLSINKVYKESFVKHYLFQKVWMSNQLFVYLFGVVFVC